MSHASPSARIRRLRTGLYAGTLLLAGLVVADPVGTTIATAIDPPEATVSGVVFEDADRDGTPGAREERLSGVAVTDGLTTVETDDRGRYTLTVDTDRRVTDLVYVSQPAGYVLPTDEFMKPRFYEVLGSLADGDQRTVDFGLTRSKEAQRDTFSFGNIADPHVNAQLADQIREINSTSTDLGFIQVSGDLTNNATQAEFDTYNRATAGSLVPVWPAVGNHEYFSGGGTGYAARIDNYRRNVGPEWYSFDYGNRHFLVLENNGAAPFDEQLDWIEDDLARHVGDDTRLVVLAHQPMNVPFGSPSTYDAYGRIFEQFGAELMLVGHEHSNHVEADSDFAAGAKHIQTVSSSYTIDNAPRGFRYIHMSDDSFENPFRMYGADQTLTIVSPAPGSSVPADGFPGVQVNAYDTGDEVRSARYRLDDGPWRPLQASGEFTWWRDLPDSDRHPGAHRLDVQVTDDSGSTWGATAEFTLTDDAAIPVEPGTDWAQHHGDPAHRGVAPAMEPGRRLAWSYRTEGTFLTGSPVIADGVVYAGTRDENGEGNSRLHAVDLRSGRSLWTYEVPQSIHGSLAVADGLVFVPTLGAELYAVDARTGQLRWKTAPEEAPAPNNQRAYGYYSPAVADGKVLWPYQTRYGIGSQGVLKALDTRTGDTVWAAPMTGSTMSDGTPAIADGTVYVGNQTADRVLAFDLATGERTWVGQESLGGWQDGVPTAAGGRVFIGSNNGIVARAAGTGERLWSFRSPHASLVSSGATPSAAAVAGDVVCMGFPSGAVSALDARTGAVIWDRRLPGELYRGGISSSPVVAGDTVFVGSNNGRFYALDRRTGQPLWEHEIGTWVGAGPAVSGNTVVAGAWDGNLYAYTPGGTAAERWATVTGAVTDPGTGEPVDGARVTATGPDGATTATSTAADGTYVLGLQPGAWTVSAGKRGYLAGDGSRASVTVGATGTTTADLTLTKVTAPVAGRTSVAPDYGPASTRTDVVPGDTYHYVMNEQVRASVVTRVDANNQPGVFRPGGLADLFLNDATGMETLDWSEMVLAPTMNDPARPWGRSGEWLDLPDVTVDGDAVVASGTAQVDPSLQASVRYRALEDAPVVKMTLTLHNTGSTNFDGYFHYNLDPDSSSDVARIPGIAATNPGFRTSGWTSDYVYVGANAPNGQPAHGIAWAEDQPTGVSAFGYITGAWFDASVDAGQTRTVSWYHLTDYPGATDPTSQIARWADRIDQLDPDVPDRSRAAGTVTDPAGAPLPGVRVTVGSGATQVATTTDAQGRYTVRAEPGEHDVRASALGRQSAHTLVSVPAGGTGTADLSLAPVTVEAGTGKRLGAGLVEAGYDDVVLENQRLALAVSDGFDDPQLAGATRGKPVDAAPAGRADQLDWLNLAYVSATEPAGTEAWQQRGFRADTVEVLEASGSQAVVRMAGEVAGVTGLRSTTTYTLRPGDAWVTATTTLANTGPTATRVWTGDAIDHDGAGQFSGVAGTGPVTTPYAEPAAYTPDGRWIAMSGTDPQAIGLVYGSDAGDFTAYGTGNWIMSRFVIDLPPGGTSTLTRRIVVAPTTGADPFEVVAAVPAP